MWIKLVELTGFTDNIGSYPTVNQLINLAARVKTILGYNTLITYAADWSEYHTRKVGGLILIHYGQVLILILLELTLISP
ncbi:glycoside hydrolase TIM-barrel-like domain-containing protein [Candidatus Tisiphia endosymbiont of Ptychoptera albimana]|uniref:baseplate megatron protein TIM-barrel domain-containing protein n=1 Tax=Candidatus Tisiphia endosymbiont of Ptychoptera albimana TaxID=3066260 RepID=UPI0039778447